MNLAIVVDNPDGCRFAMPGIPTVSARSYLMESGWRERRGLTVVNRCRSRGYQRYGYYVSLLAEARGHRTIPGAAFIKDLGGQPVRLLAATTQNCIDRCRPCREEGSRLAILRDPDAECTASNDAAIEKFERAALAHGILPERVGRDDIARLPGFDALFIRDNTFVRHYTYRFSRRAADAGLALVDDPDSLLRCNSKVYLAELLPRHGIPIPKTLIVDRSNLELIAPELGLPCVLKRPDSSLSLGVVRVDSLEDLLSTARHMLIESDLLVAQEYLPTPFDWRIAVLDGRPLFACKYHMVPGHWQIVRHVPGQHYEEGRTEALPLGAAPKAAVGLALRAAHLIGNGFYGVDLKEVASNDFRVIEVNDNPNVDAGNEDGVLGDALYDAVMKVFARRMAMRRRWRP